MIKHISISVLTKKIKASFSSTRRLNDSSTAFVRFWVSPWYVQNARGFVFQRSKFVQHWVFLVSTLLLKLFLRFDEYQIQNPTLYCITSFLALDGYGRFRLIDEISLLNLYFNIKANGQHLRYLPSDNLTKLIGER